MARFKLMAPFESISGKLGDAYVYSKNRAGTYMKTFVPPDNPNTALQVAARSIFGAVAALWLALSVANRTLWNSYANTDYLPLNPKTDTDKYTGRQAYSALIIACRWLTAFIAEYTGFGTTVTFNGVTTTSNVFKTITESTSPPVALSGANTFTLDTITKSITDFDITSNTSGRFDIKLILDSAIAAATYTAKPVLIGGAASAVGVYISNSLTADGEIPNVEFAQKYRMSKVVDTLTVTVGAACDNVTYVIQDSNTGFVPITGWRKVTVVAQDMFGQQNVLISKWILFTNA